MEETSTSNDQNDGVEAGENDENGKLPSKRSWKENEAGEEGESNVLSPVALNIPVLDPMDVDSLPESVDSGTTSQPVENPPESVSGGNVPDSSTATVAVPENLVNTSFANLDKQLEIIQAQKKQRLEEFNKGLTDRIRELKEKEKKSQNNDISMNVDAGTTDVQATQIVVDGTDVQNDG